jgi:hypothetical protein
VERDDDERLNYLLNRCYDLKRPVVREYQLACGGTGVADAGAGKAR